MSLPPPHALDAEAAVLSTVLLKPSALDDVATLLRAEDFYADANRLAYAAAVELHHEDAQIDLVTVVQRLRDRGELAKVGGAAYLAQIVDATPAVAHVETHASLVADKAKLRRLIAACQTIAAEGYTAGDVAAFVDEAEAKICAIADTTAAKGPAHALEAVRVAFTAIAADAEGKATHDPPIATGLAPLDRVLPLHRQRMTTVAASTGIGKTTLALQIATCAAEAKVGALFVSLEMPAAQLMRRATFQLARVDSAKIRNHHALTKADWSALTDAGTRIGRAPLWLDDSEEHNPMTIRASVRRTRAMARRAGFELGLVVVDYLQLVDGRGAGRDANREQQVAYIARRLKVLSRAENVHVIALAQLNGDAEKQDRRPRMSDLRESKAVAMHSDNVALIHAPGALDRSDRRIDQGYSAPEGESVNLYVDKQRDGAPGRVELVFFPGQTLFAAPAGWTGGRKS